MCKHTDLTFIGYQECIDGSSLPLYNCRDCHTTIVVRSDKDALKRTNYRLKTIPAVSNERVTA